jgi:hypothetical protein
MNARERFHAVMNFQPVDRLPMIEWAGWWDKTYDRWLAEGLPADLDFHDTHRYFGLDVHFQYWPIAYTPDCPDDAMSRPVASLADYESLRPHLYPKSILTDHWKRNLTKHLAIQETGEAILWYTLEGFFWFPRRLMGIEPHMLAFYDQPELLHRINADLCEWLIGVVEELQTFGVDADFVTFAEDLSYNHGPMLSRASFEEFLAPYYRRVLPVIKKHRDTLALIDTDGLVNEALPWFAEAGLDGILPLERQAGVDLAEIRRDFPDMRFIGHYNKLVMKHGRDAMRAEFERLLPIARQGGYVMSVDHQTPPDVSLENYRIYMELFAEYAVRAAKGD